MITTIAISLAAIVVIGALAYLADRHRRRQPVADPRWPKGVSHRAVIGRATVPRNHNPLPIGYRLDKARTFHTDPDAFVPSRPGENTQTLLVPVAPLDEFGQDRAAGVRQILAGLAGDDTAPDWQREMARGLLAAYDTEATP